MNALHPMKNVAAAAAVAAALAGLSAQAATPADAPSAIAPNLSPTTRAQVMAEFYEARRLGLLDNGGDAGPSEQVLARREAYNRDQAEQWMAQQRAAQTAGASTPADSVVVVNPATGQRVVAPPGSLLLVTPADTDAQAGTQALSPQPGAAAPEIQADEVIVVDVPQAAPAPYRSQPLRRK